MPPRAASATLAPQGVVARPASPLPGPGGEDLSGAQRGPRVPNTFEQQARERLGRSLAFMAKSQSLLGDDLLYRSALADAVSAIKNMLQGYLLLRIAATPPSGVTQAWQEIANSNRMPELIAACAEAGLDLHGLAPEIKRLNAERNYRTHEDPARLVDATQADHALKVARDVQKRIRDAVQGRGVARGAAVARAVEGARAVSGQLRMGTQAATAARARTAQTPSPDEVFGDTAAFASRAEPLPAPAATDGAAASASANGHASTAGLPSEKAPGAEKDDADAGDDAGDTGEMSALTPPRRHGRFGRALLRAAAVIVLLAIGVAGGLFLGTPIAAGHAPSWLAFMPGVSIPATPTATTAPPTPVATAVIASGPTTLGTLAIATPVCDSGRVTLTLTNGGTQPLAYSAAGGSAGIALATTAAGPRQQTVFGTLKPGVSQTLYIAGANSGASLVITAPAGMVQLRVPSC